MDDLNEFSDVIKGISSYILDDQYIPKHCSIPLDEKTLHLSYDHQQFLEAKFPAFEKAQKELIGQIILYEKHLDRTRKLLKSAHRDKVNTKNLEGSINIIKNRLLTLRHLGDSIAWSLLDGEIHFYRRLYINQKNSPTLANSNIEHCIKIADQLNSVENNFALLCDITNSVQLGDLLVYKDGKISLEELKEGSVNNKLKALQPSEVTTLPEKMKKQYHRIQRQNKRLKDTTEVIENDEGIDAMGRNIRLLTPNVGTKRYHETLEFLTKKILKGENWSYSVIDSCLHIGFYKDRRMALAAPELLKMIVSKNCENFIISNWRNIVVSVSEPIFFKPLPLRLLVDILSGSLNVYMALDCDAFLKLFKCHDIQARWLSRKETHKLKEVKDHDAFIVNNRAIAIVNHEGQEVIIGGGIISKIFFDCIYPSNIIETFAKQT